MHLLIVVSLFASTVLANTAIAPGVELIPGRFVQGTQPDGNSIVFRAPKGLIVVDTGRHPEHTQAIIDFARASREPIVAILNTHWHLDHIGGNPMLRREYPAVRVYATSALADAQKGFLARYRSQLEDMIGKTTNADEQKPWRAEIALIDSGRALAADEVIAKPGRRTIAGRKIDLHLEHGATAGDLWLFDPATKVVVAGDLVTLPVPFLDTACPAAWKDALDHLAAVKFSFLVPGHGAPMHRAEFEMYRTAFSNLLACGTSGKSKDACISGWLDDAGPLIRDENPAFVRSLVSYYVELVGKPCSDALH